MEKKELLIKLDEIRKEINNLKLNLDKLNKEKESWFHKKEQLKKDISSLVKEIKNIKHDKDSANITIKGLRDERDNYNKKVRELIIKIKELNKNKADFIKKNEVKVDPEQIKKKIDELEFKIETEALSMNKEKSVMKQIKDLRKIYEKNIGLKKIIDEINKVDREIKENKNKSDESHKKIRGLINSNDPGYKKFKEDSTRINNLRKEQQEAFEKFISLKNEFLKVQENLGKKLAESNETRKQLDEINNKAKLDRKARQEDELKERERLVEEKLKIKKKLTKDDLIMLQR